ncbi:hypothetical protein BDN71DRAFT_1449722 [Pleurotus eryngii]|uniref:Uncharacterized protein n=1 Tax=Pleurotus eryngii TaxID=5323 RepID=A0A9P5ZY35_PLEER|nr:hypothetical protein BDN71DRAFT_1449722 [Pleurotus eryngii]
MSRQDLPIRLFLALVVSQNTLQAAAQTVGSDERSGSRLSTQAGSGILLAILGLCFIIGLGMCLAIGRKRRQRLASPSPPVYVSPEWGGPPRPRAMLPSRLSARHGGVEDGVGSRYWHQGFRSPSMPAATPLPPPPYGHPLITPPPPPAYTKDGYSKYDDARV